ncbi:MAG: hypothetical protein ACKO04_08580, partial [Actinomycetes bacterium]
MGTPDTTPPRVRVLLHAADRTGPPMLARALLRHLRRTHPAVPLDVVAFRGGAMVPELAELAATTVLLHDHEPWDHEHPDPARTAEVAATCAALPDADVLLLVSISAG